MSWSMSILTFVISSVFTFSKQPSMALMSIYECLWKGADKKCFQRPRGAKTDFFCLDSVKHLLTTAAAVCVVFVHQLNNQWRLSGKKIELKENIAYPGDRKNECSLIKDFNPLWEFWGLADLSEQRKGHSFLCLLSRSALKKSMNQKIPITYKRVITC